MLVEISESDTQLDVYINPLFPRSWLLSSNSSPTSLISPTTSASAIAHMQAEWDQGRSSTGPTSAPDSVEIIYLLQSWSTRYRRSHFVFKVTPSFMVHLCSTQHPPMSGILLPSLHLPPLKNCQSNTHVLTPVVDGRTLKYRTSDPMSRLHLGCFLDLSLVTRGNQERTLFYSTPSNHHRRIAIVNVSTIPAGFVGWLA